MELVQQQGGKVDNDGYTALIRLFRGISGKTYFGSNGFKLLWKKEKDINADELRKLMHENSNLKEKVVTAILEAVTLYE